MINNKVNKVEKDLVLLGAGHANVNVITYIGKTKPKGIRVTLISDNLYSTYSGMIPGYIQGSYSWKDINIDILRLANKFNIRVIQATVTNVLHSEKMIYLEKRPPINYDILSINLGIISKKNNIIGAVKNTYSLKPISKVKETISKTLEYYKKSDKKENLVIIGGGAAGVEVSLAFNSRLNKLKIKHQIYLISKNKTVINSFSKKAQNKVIKKLKSNNIILITNTEVRRITKDFVIINNRKKIKCRNVILSTSAAPPKWLCNTDLRLSKNKFISVNNTLSVIDKTGVFAVGDIAEIINFPNPKAGVFAVKQGRVLKKNILSFIEGKKLKNYVPQKNFISILGMSDSTALLNRGNIFFINKIIWKLKKIIDKNFINKFNIKDNINSFKNNKSEDPFDFDMQCGGCASKVPQKILAEVFSENISKGSLDAEKIPNSNKLFHTVDIITNIVNDPFKLGMIAAKHSINDVISTNSIPISAQMILGLPPTNLEIISRDINQIKQGALSYMEKFSCKITGGHTFSIDTEQTAVGFSIIGKQLIKKKPSLLLSGSKVLLTNKIGSAMIIAGIKRNMINSNHLIEVLEDMTSNNLGILKIFNKYKISQITDISGFGLAIHLSNLIKRYGENLGADINLEKINLYKGAYEAINKNIISSLSNSNKYYLKDKLEIKKNKNYLENILFDPQTAGGFLFIYNGNVKKILQDFSDIKVPCSVIGYINKKNKIRVL